MDTRLQVLRYIIIKTWTGSKHLTSTRYTNELIGLIYRRDTKENNLFENIYLDIRQV